jgi:hypothetical protein
MHRVVSSQQKLIGEKIRLNLKNFSPNVDQQISLSIVDNYGNNFVNSTNVKSNQVGEINLNENNVQALISSARPKKGFEGSNA